MEFIAVTFNSTPNVCVAHEYDIANTEWTIPSNPRTLEIALVEKGALEMTEEDTGAKWLLKEGCAYVAVHKQLHVQTVGAIHKHITVGFAADERIEGLSENDVINMASKIGAGNKLTAILPMSFDSIDSAAINLKLKKLNEFYNSPDFFRSIKTTAILFDILSFATTRSVELAQKEVLGVAQYNHVYYCHEAMKYIIEHISEPIGVEDIAQKLNISYGHLSRLFKKQTNYTLIDYINKEKVRKMEELLWSKKLSVSAAAQAVGISDDKYASRLFRKYTGLTIGAYIKRFKK